ncbi:MAG: hypothetical protein IKO39_06155, partial [Treponema sp.]|nr:hypothetical protein [Treponema sp.]
MKKKNLSLLFGFRLGVEIVILITVLAIATIFTVQKGMERTYMTSTTELIQAHVQGLSYRNSKFMQQLRMYTVSDPVQAGGSAEDLIQWIVSHRKSRSSDFSEIAFCNYEDGKAYTDDGKVYDVSSTEYYQFMKNSGKSQYISNPVGTSAEDSAYYVCKSVSIHKKHVGFVAGAVSHARLSDAIEAIKVGEKGYTMLLAGDGTIMAFPNHDIVMRENFTRDNPEYPGLPKIAKAMIAGESGSGWVKSPSGSELMVYAPVS